MTEKREYVKLAVDHNGAERFAFVFDGDQANLLAFLAHFSWPVSLGMSLVCHEDEAGGPLTRHELLIRNGVCRIFQGAILCDPAEAAKLVEGLNANAVMTIPKAEVDIREAAASDATANPTVVGQVG